ncbi:inositol monophosphatase family protein [Sphaerimonospora thailandensis]|uniref:inositol-phosphate phosphatase n=1 Tax=Sphaerimonospora thailandensis TaxID=795644 RepID=A0A8J3RB34_9ACTN|nr:inositol monophosphatase family protein [Sphaerimonospora thailandensis]GIH72791.1 inositol monophosphatase [Sphaerimonospora thailandensis]
MTVDARALLRTAEQAVTIAGRLIRTKDPGVVTTKGDRDMVTDIDYAVEHVVREFLSRETPEFGFLGEEEGLSRTGDGGLMWALDPVDGTANFARGIPLCGVSLGLIEAGRPVLGVIDLPYLGAYYCAAEGAGATANGQRIRAHRTYALSAAIVSVGDYAVGEGAEAENRIRLPLYHWLAARVQRVRMLGSAAVDLAWVAEGKTDAFITLSNNPWDTAAGVAIAREAGAVVADIDGGPHTTKAQATIAATPGILTDLIALITQARQDADRTAQPAEACHRKA